MLKALVPGILLAVALVCPASLLAQTEAADVAKGTSVSAAGWSIGAGTYAERQDYRPPDARIFLRREGEGRWRFSDDDSPSDMMVEVLALDLTLRRLWLDADPETYAARDQRRSNVDSNLRSGKRRYLCATANRLFTSSKIEDRMHEGYNVCTSVFRGDSGGLLGLEGVEIDKVKIAEAIERAGGFPALLGMARDKAVLRQAQQNAVIEDLVRFQQSLTPGTWTSCGMVTAISGDLVQVQGFDGRVAWLYAGKLRPRGYPVADCSPARR